MRIACNSEHEVPGDQECLITKFSEEFVDCSITEKGYQQVMILWKIDFILLISIVILTLKCAKAREICANEDVAMIFVSPLRRCLETCKEIFHGHKSNPKIIPNPLFREMMLSNCDVGGRILESVQLYPEDDFSFLKAYKYPNLWSLYELLDKEKLEEVIKKIEDLCGNDE